jgi:nitroreductase
VRVIPTQNRATVPQPRAAHRAAPEPSIRAIDTMLSRVSISRLREPAPQGRELDLILQTAMRAPDHGRLRPWRLVLVRGPARHALADVIATALRHRQPDVIDEVVERQRGKIINAPLVIALGAHIRPEHKVPELEQMLSVGAAAMNMLNAIHALGYGGIWVTGPNAYDSRVADALGFPAPDRLLGFLFVGTPMDQPAPQNRPDIEAHVSEWTGVTNYASRAN